MKPGKLSIIIPSLNEAEQIIDTLTPLQALRQRGHEIILADGGSFDNTLELASPLVDYCLQGKAGRGQQMNHGASVATGDVLCFIHADTRCPDNLDQLLSETLCKSKKIWGRFDIRLSSPYWVYRIIEWFMNKRSCLTGVATGDQGIFICRNIFTKISGFAEFPLMEDIEISKRLRKISRPVCIHRIPLITSSRRWEKNGILRTMLQMWSLRLRYFLGSSVTALAREYYPQISHAQQTLHKNEKH